MEEINVSFRHQRILHIPGLSWFFFLVIQLAWNIASSQNIALTEVPGYEHFLVQKNVMIPAIDGIKLATDIYFPANNGKLVEEKLPLLLQRTPYGKTAERFLSAINTFTERGYIVAVQDLRGRYDSEGSFTKYSAMEGSDGAATIE